MNKESFNGQISVATSALCKIEIYNPTNYKRYEVLYFQDPEEGRAFADNFFDTHSVEDFDYQEYYRDDTKSRWEEVQY